VNKFVPFTQLINNNFEVSNDVTISCTYMYTWASSIHSLRVKHDA